MSHRTGIQLTKCYALSFTDPSLRPYQVSCEFPPGDLSINVDGWVSSTDQVAVYPGRAGFSQCQADTAYLAPGSAANPDVNGSHGPPLTDRTLCVTMTDRIAVCYVTDDTTGESIPAPGLILDVAVYALK